MEIFIVHGWKGLALRGLGSMLFGLIAFLWPSITLVSLVVLFGVYALVDGVLAMTVGMRQSERRHAWIFTLEGAIGITVGIAALIWPGITTLALVYFIGSWAILTGALEVMLAIQLKDEVSGEFLLGLGGAASILLGALLLFWPGTGVVALVTLLACYALSFGALLLTQALRLRRLTSTRPTPIVGIRARRHASY